MAKICKSDNPIKIPPDIRSDKYMQQYELCNTRENLLIVHGHPKNACIAKKDRESLTFKINGEKPTLTINRILPESYFNKSYSDSAD